MAKNSASDPFEPQGETWENACVDNYIGLSELSEYYIASADELVGRSLDDSNLLDIHVYAICFLYRHGLELALKDMVWKSHYIITGEKRFRMKMWRELGRHRLGILWTSACPDIKKILLGNWPLTPESEKKVMQLLQQFERHDPDSYSFRYPFGKREGRTHQDLNNVNIRVLRERVHEIAGYLGTLLIGLDWCYENYRDL